MFVRLNVLAIGAAFLLGPATAYAGLQSCNAGVCTVQDDYWGGNDTHNYGDSIGGGIYNVSDAVISRSNNGNTLNIRIDTAYAGHAGSEFGVGYGDLFITPGVNAWSPQGSGGDNGFPHYHSDVYQPGDWTYAFTMPQLPGSGSRSGTGGLYHSDPNNANNEGTIVLSNVQGHTSSYPTDPTSPFYFRDHQAVDFTVAPGKSQVAGGTWQVDQSNGFILFSIVDNGLLGMDFAFSWAMTCANDIIQGQVDLPDNQIPRGAPGPTVGGGLPGLVLGGLLVWRMRRRGEGSGQLV